VFDTVTFLAAGAAPPATPANASDVGVTESSGAGGGPAGAPST
jgi:hypothetical protein